MSDQLVPAVPGRSRVGMEALAKEYVQKWAPHLLGNPEPFPVFESFDSLEENYPGLVSGVAPLPAGVEGVCCPDGRVFLSEPTYEQLAEGNGRARFTTIHEICHALHHRRYLTRALVEVEAGRLNLFRRSSVPAYIDPEWQANVFAAAVLMPAEAVALVCRNRPMLAENRVQDTFGVSYQAAKIRVETLRKTGVI